MSLFSEMLTKANGNLPLMQEITSHFNTLNNTRLRKVIAKTDKMATGKTTDLPDDFDDLQKAVKRICEIAESLGLDTPFTGDINDKEALEQFSLDVNMEIFHESMEDE